MDARHVVVVGGSATGMATALALWQDGRRVTVLERDRMPPCESALAAFESWPRPGAPQARHSHAFLARLHNGIRERAPGLYAALLAAGAEPMRFSDMARGIFPQPALVSEDEEITLLACRRLTFDWVLRRHLETATGVRWRDGVAVEGLAAERDAATGLPRVVGVRARGAAGGLEVLCADLVVDASGRRSALGSWLAEIGARPLREESEPCGIFYSSRFYRLRPGVVPPPIEGPIGADLGYMKYAIFPGDSRIFSVTLAASPDDAALRAVLQPAAFEAATAALPATRGWVDPAVSEPITKVYGFGDLENTLRLFVEGGEPPALGVFPLGDALAHTNPLSGRGCTLGWMGAFLLADAFRRHPDDSRAFARALWRDISREVIPWYESIRDQDRAAARTAELASTGADPFAFERADGTLDPAAYLRSLLRDGLVPALREDLVVMRAFMRVFNMLDSPRDVLGSPDVLRRVLAAWQRRGEREPLRLGPPREQMVEALRAAAGRISSRHARACG